PDTSAGLNMLVASTYGRGDFAIRIDDSQYRQFLVIPHPGPQVAGVTALTGTFGKTLTGLTVTFAGPVDPTTFSPADIRSVTGPSGNALAVQDVFNAPLPAPAGPGKAHNA